MTGSWILNRSLILEKPHRVEDGSGGFQTNWVQLGRLWAHLEPRRGRESFAGGRTRSQVPYRIVVRGAPVGAASRPCADQRFREGERVYEILSVSEADARGNYLEIEALEGSRL
ncbi:MAG: phage head closure protein [Pseudomonadota bacterium]